MKRVVIVITHAMTWFWTQACLAALKRTLAAGAADGFDVEIVVVDNSWDNSQSIRSVTDTRLGQGVRVINNTMSDGKGNLFMCHSAAMDLAFASTRPMDYFIPIDSDCITLRTDWFRQLFDRLRPTDFAVGAPHAEGGVCCSFAMYRGEVVGAMADASAANPDRYFRWGDRFNNSVPAPDGCEKLLEGPFSERRGFAPGTVLKESPPNQMRNPGHYEPGQQFHYWAVNAGYTYTICTAKTFRDDRRGIPLGTFYGVEPYSGITYDEAVHASWAIHFWAGTRALDFLNPRGGDLKDAAIVDNMGFWLEREGGWWMNQVPEDVRTETLKLINKYGLSSKMHPDARADSTTWIKACYAAGGVPI